VANVVRRAIENGAVRKSIRMTLKNLTVFRQAPKCWHRPRRAADNTFGLCMPAPKRGSQKASHLVMVFERPCFIVIISRRRTLERNEERLMMATMPKRILSFPPPLSENEQIIGAERGLASLKRCLAVRRTLLF
jgi:hypothetical protein